MSVGGGLGSGSLRDAGWEQAGSRGVHGSGSGAAEPPPPPPFGSEWLLSGECCKTWAR